MWLKVAWLTHQTVCTQPLSQFSFFFLSQQWNEPQFCLCLFWKKRFNNKIKKTFLKESLSPPQLEIDWRIKWLNQNMTAIYKWGSEEQKDGDTRLVLRGERERSPQLPQIMLPSSPHLGESQASTPPKCNGEVSTWRNCLDDHSFLWAR